MHPKHTEYGSWKGKKEVMWASTDTGLKHLCSQCSMRISAHLSIPHISSAEMLWVIAFLSGCISQ
jgi:hypothetical protein